MNFKGETIWIIGASSGIGYNLAIELANKGASLILSARRDVELKSLQKKIGKQHNIYPLDVSSKKQVSSICSKISKEFKKVDRVIFMPALYRPDSIEKMDLDFMSKMIDVNIKGALYVTCEILPIMQRQKSGQIVLCGSVAGYTGLPNGQPYSASKAAIINFAESLFAEVPKYIDVKLISPGFVSTPMTAKNDFKMPMIISPKQAANFIVKGLVQNSFEIDFPWKFTMILKLISLLPYNLKFWITKKMTKAH